MEGPRNTEFPSESQGRIAGESKPLPREESDMLESETVYTVGEPIPYDSIYGYDKRRFPILRADDGAVVGHAGEEIVKGVNGKRRAALFTRAASRACRA
jgi:hypothetical protein